MEDKIYRLEEMLDSMNASLENIQKITEQQQKLIALVEEHGKDDFADFIKESREQLENLKKQYELLITKRDALQVIIAGSKASAEKGAFLNLILDTLINF